MPDRLLYEPLQVTDGGAASSTHPIRTRDVVTAVIGVVALVASTVTVTAAGEGQRVSPLRVSDLATPLLEDAAIRQINEPVYVRQHVDPYMTVSGIPPGLVWETIAVTDPGATSFVNPIRVSESVERDLRTISGPVQSRSESVVVTDVLVEARFDQMRLEVSDQVYARDGVGTNLTASVGEDIATYAEAGQSFPIGVREWVDAQIATRLSASTSRSETGYVRETVTRDLRTLSQIDQAFVREHVDHSWATVTPSGITKDLAEDPAARVRDLATAERRNAFEGALVNPRVPVTDDASGAIRQIGFYASVSETLVLLREADVEDLRPARREVHDLIVVTETDRHLKGPSTGGAGRFAFRRRFGFRG